MPQLMDFSPAGVEYFSNCKTFRRAASKSDSSLCNARAVKNGLDLNNCKSIPANPIFPIIKTLKYFSRQALANLRNLFFIILPTGRVIGKLLFFSFNWNLRECTRKNMAHNNHNGEIEFSVWRVHGRRN